MADNSNFYKTAEIIVKGVFAGGAIGALAGWVGIMPLGRGIGMGMLCGCLASLTFKDRMEDRQAKKDKEDR